MTVEPLVVLIVGVPGAGKTTVARALAERLPRSACIEGDLVQHHFTVNGLVGPGGLPAEESTRQLELRWDNCAALARNFWRTGFSVVVEHAASRRSWVERFASEMGDVPVSLVVLAPALTVALERGPYPHREAGGRTVRAHGRRAEAGARGPGLVVGHLGPDGG
ncbi:MAG TPA: AAA family ATPase [Propionibacteriaceae bacterium]|nr:AAA family ATPase [Propionibacteriaceae bacterium]